MELLIRPTGHGDRRHGQTAPTCRCLQALQTLGDPTRQTKIGGDVVKLDVSGVTRMRTAASARGGHAVINGNEQLEGIAA